MLSGDRSAELASPGVQDESEFCEDCETFGHNISTWYVCIARRHHYKSDPVPLVHLQMRCFEGGFRKGAEVTGDLYACVYCVARTAILLYSWHAPLHRLAEAYPSSLCS